MDAIVIGSGIGGLTSAVLLAQLGRRVTVVEKNRQPGGMMRSYSRNGIDCPVGVHYISSLGPGEPLAFLYEKLGILDRIPFERMGRSGIIDRYIFDDFSFDLPPSLELFEVVLRDKFPAEQKQISALMDKLKQAAASIGTIAGVLAPENSMGPTDMETSDEFLTRLGCSGRLKQIISVSGYLVGMRLEECPAWIHFTTLAAYLASSWRLAAGGAQMADVFAARLAELGGRLILGDPVREIEVEQKRATGVRLASGIRIKADEIVSSLHPKVTLSLLPEKAFNPARAARVQALPETSGVFCVQAAVPAATQPALDHNLYRVKSGANQEPTPTFLQVRETARPDWNLLTAIRSSSIDDWSAWSETAFSKRGRGYRAQKDAWAAELMEEAADVLGPLGQATVIDSYTPLTLRDWVNAPQGGAYGLKRSLEQLLTVVQLSRRGVGGLFLVGQSVMAPGILGVTLGVLKTLAPLVGKERLFTEPGLKE
ncbi:MAG: NAD(P)/FAD-dependent oxidoreductase [Pseudomonadota bacterium]